MCARTTLSKKDLREVAEGLEAEFSEEDARVHRPRYNSAPSDTLWILRHGADRRVIGPAVWGYRPKGRPLINVRGESAGVGSFREAFSSRRCRVAVPAPPSPTIESRGKDLAERVRSRVESHAIVLGNGELTRAWRWSFMPCARLFRDG